MHCERLFFNNFLGKLAFGLSVASIVCTIIVAIVIVALYFALFYGNYTLFIHYYLGNMFGNTFQERYLDFPLRKGKQIYKHSYLCKKI